MTHTPDNPKTPETPEERPECFDLLEKDRPTPQEVDSMWNAIAAALPVDQVETSEPRSFWTRKYVREIVYSLATAACIALLFCFGQWHYSSVVRPEAIPDASISGKAWQEVSSTAEGIDVRDGDISLGAPIEAGERLALGYYANDVTSQDARGREIRRGGVAVSKGTEKVTRLDSRGDLFSAGRQGVCDFLYFGATNSDVDADGVMLYDEATVAANSFLLGDTVERHASSLSEARSGVVRLGIEEVTDVYGLDKDIDYSVPVSAGISFEAAESSPSAVNGMGGGMGGASMGGGMGGWDSVIPVYDGEQYYDLSYSARGYASTNEALWDDKATTSREDATWYSMANAPEPLPATEDSPHQPAPQVSPGKKLVEKQRRVVTNAWLTLEVEQYSVIEQRVLGILSEYDAYVQNSEIKEEQVGGSVSGRLTIRVSPALFDSLFASLKTFGRVESENVSAEDVSGQWVDLEARIRSGLVEEKQLLGLLERDNYFDDIESLLTVERELARVRTEIEQMQSQLRNLSNRVSLCTIYLTLHEIARTQPSADIVISVREVPGAEARLHSLLEEADVRLVSGQTADVSGGPLRGTFNLSVPRKSFSTVLDGLEKLGRVLKQDVRGFQPGDEEKDWAARMYCPVSLVLQEYSYQIPGGTIKLEVADLTKTLDALQPLLTETKATIAESNTKRRDDDSRIGELKIQVAAGRFRTFAKTIESLGRPLAVALSGETGEILGGSADVLSTLNLTLAEQERQVPTGKIAIRVKEFTKARDSLGKIVNDKTVQVQASSSRQEPNGATIGEFRLAIRAEAMEDTVARIEGIGTVSYREIDGLGLGNLSKVNPNAWGVIQIVFIQPPPTAPTQEQSTGKLQQAMRDGLKGLYSSLGMILYGVVVLLPWVVILLVVIFVGKKIMPRRKSKTTEKIAQEKSES